MLQSILDHRTEIARLCERYEVARLGIFGSALSSAFDTTSSDVDVVIDFTDAGRVRAFDNYFGLKEALAEMLGRPIDLVTRTSISNPVFRREVDATTEVIYAQAA
jgi:uncharacterized protein